MGINADSMIVNFGKNLRNSGEKLSLYSQRLASGLRINSAQDDAANLGLSEKFKATVNSSSILKDNASTGLDALKTTDGDLEQISKILQRMRDLTVQGLNGVYSDSEKAMIMNEVNQLGVEIKRITQSSTFSDKKLLDSTASANNPLQVYIDDKGSDNYIDLSSVSKNMLFADILAKDQNVYMLGMAPGQTSYVEFNNKIYKMTNTSTTDKNLIYGYNEDLGNENNSLNLIDDSEGITTSFVGPYQNDQVQMGNGEMYLNLNGGQTANFTVGGNVFSLTNSDASQQTAVFKTSGTTLNMVSGQNVSGTFNYALSGYNTAAGTETAITLNGSEQKYINYGGKLYSLQNNSGTQETFIYRNNAGNLQSLSGNVTPSLVGNISGTTNLNGDKYEKLSASQELFYDNGGTIYSLKNNTAQAQMVELNGLNNIVNANTSVTQTALSTITGSTGMANPYTIDAVAGQKYYIKSNDNSTIHELTASATGQLLIDFDGTNINSIGGVGATLDTNTNPLYENVTPDGLNQFIIDLSANKQETFTIGDEVYKISNTGGPKNNVSLTYDSLTKSISLDTPNGQITVDGYQGDLATKTVLGANEYYAPSLASGASTYIKTGTDIFKITNSSGATTNSIFNYDAGAHTLTSSTAGMSATLEPQATFTNNIAGDRGLRMFGGQTQLVQSGSDIFEITNNTANEQSIVFAFNAGNLTVNDAEIASSLTITKHVLDAGQTSLAAGDVYTTLTASGSKDLSIANQYFQIDNTSGARTVAFSKAGNNLTQLAGTGVNDTYKGDESFETTSTASDYYIEMSGGEKQYVKVGSYAYEMNNITGTTKTDVFRQTGAALTTQNPNITDLNIPLSNQDNFSQLMPVLDWSIGLVSEKRALLGTKMKTLDQTIDRNISNGIALTSANSIIRDTDIAKEQSEYVKESILRNYSTSLFKQYKDLNGQLALTLLVH